MRVLEGKGLGRRFGGLVALEGVDLSLEAGEVLGLFGPNGAGKTTLFNLLSGVLRPSAGRVFLQGVDVTPLPPHARARMGLARTFQLVQPFRSLTVLENVLLALAQDRFRFLLPLGPLETPGRREEAYRLLESVGLEGLAQRRSGELPLGALKRLEVARALALRPRVLLLDEPLAGLTVREAEEVLRVIESLRGQVAVVLIEHHVRLALRVCDRAMVLDRGRVIAQGEPMAVRVHPEVVRAYLGEEDVTA